MNEITRERVCAESDKEIVVFLIGMRINRLWKVWKWLPVVAAMPRMLKELAAKPELGLLAALPYFGGRVLGTTQYWESVEKLQAYGIRRRWPTSPHGAASTRASALAATSASGMRPM